MTLLLSSDGKPELGRVSKGSSGRAKTYDTRDSLAIKTQAYCSGSLVYVWRSDKFANLRATVWSYMVSNDSMETRVKQGWVLPLTECSRSGSGIHRITSDYCPGRGEDTRHGVG